MTHEELFRGQDRIKARALLLGERLDLRAFADAEHLGDAPLCVRAGSAGAAVLFRYGAIVIFGLTPPEEVELLRSLQALVREPHEEREVEDADLLLVPESARLTPEKPDSGVIRLHEADVARLQLVADTLAKSVILARLEESIAGAFERVEPLAVSLRRHGRMGKGDRELIAQIGEILEIQGKMVGLVEVSDKPETLWERPELERFHARLEDEYELRERHEALERKLVVLARTAETALNLLQHRGGLRVEWWIVGLIVFEIVLSLYDLFVRR